MENERTMNRNGRWRVLAPGMVICAGVSWGLIGMFTRPLSTVGISAPQITFLRAVFASAGLLLIQLVTGLKNLKIRWRDIWMFLGTGICSIVFFNICYFLCMTHSTLAIACTLLYTAPCFVVLLSCILFREALTIRMGVSIAAAFLGCSFITGLFGGGQTVTLFAILTGLGSGFGYALYSIFGRFALRRYCPLTVTTYTFLIAALALSPFVHPAALAGTLAQNLPVLRSTALLGLVSTILPFMLYTKGLEHMPTGRAALLTFVEPMVATFLSTIVFHERFTVTSGVGVVLILTAITLLNLPVRDSAPREK